MSKAIKAVANVATGGAFGAASSLFGAAGDVASGNPTFKGATRKVDEDAFKIKNADDAAARSKTQEDAASSRSTQAQSDRRGLITQLQGQADGTAPSLAEAQLKSASDRSLAQQLAASQSQRGGSASSRERQLLRNQSSAGRDIAQQSATARIQEQQAAQAQLGTQISQEQQLADQLTQNYLAQGFNIEQAQQQASADYEKLQTNQFLAAQGLSAASTESAAGRQAGLLGGVLNAGGSAVAMSDKKAKKKIKKVSAKDVEESMKRMSSGPSKTNIKPVTNKDVAKVAEAAKKDSDSSKVDKVKVETKEEKEAKSEAKKKKLAEGLSSSFSTSTGSSGSQEGNSLFKSSMSKISDKEEKTNKKALSDSSIKKDFLDKLQAYKYEYKKEHHKNPLAGPGTHMSVMAQDLEKAGPIGKSMVESNEEGIKQVDYAKGYGAILAAQAHLNKRLDELESKKKKGK